MRALAVYDKHNYLNRDMSPLINVPIREYDMKSGGLAVLRASGALTPEEAREYEAMEKRLRNVRLGQLMRERRELSEIRLEGFRRARRAFVEANGIPEDRILSVKMDAIFVVNFPAEALKVGEVEFQLKNTYSSFYLLNGKEFYFKGITRELDVKGLGREVVEAHADHFLKKLAEIFTVAERGNRSALIRSLRRLRSQYLNRQLDIECYRELNLENAFRTTGRIAGEIAFLETADSLEGIDIGYNYVRYIAPLIGLYV